LEYVLDKSVVIQRYENTAAVGYGQKMQWNFVKDAMAKIIVKAGDTQAAPQGPLTFDRVDIIVYYDDAIDMECRVVYNRQKYKIRHMQEIGEQNIGQKMYLKLTAIKWYEKD